MFIILRGGAWAYAPPRREPTRSSLLTRYAFQVVNAGVMHLAGSTLTQFLDPDHINNDSWSMMIGHDDSCILIYETTKKFLGRVMYHHHPSWIIVDVVGIEEPSRGRSCEVHDTCGDIVAVDTIVLFRAVQLICDQGKEETAITYYWVTNGIDRCRVGFLPHDCMKHKSYFDEKLAQGTEFQRNIASNSPALKYNTRRETGIPCSHSSSW